MKQVVTVELNGQTISIETGRLAKQADSVLVTCGSNVVLVTAVTDKDENDADFFPLTVEYVERFYSTGKIPGGYFKREGRPTNEAILTCRLIDRPIRPCFPEGYNQETQVIATVLSFDGQYPVASLASLGASAALHISEAPFKGPVGSLLVGRVGGKWVANPTIKEQAESDVHMIVAGTKNGILMVEGETDFIKEADVLAGLKFGHGEILKLIGAQEELRKKAGKKKMEFKPKAKDETFVKSVRDFLKPKITQALATTQKMERYALYDAAKTEAKAKFLTDDLEDKEGRKKELGAALEALKYELSRQMILEKGKRIDGRDTVTVRPISCEVGILPRTHGSGLFTRGETQVLGTVTLGTADDEQKIDSLQGFITKKFMLHYNFPPFSVGECGRVGAQSRREVGHGFLAERAISAILPDYDKFPYTIRLVSEVLESNGSSSMGTVCSGLLALLDAGVPVKGNVAGIAMGLIKEGDKYAVLSDILGDEDHLGDMDFKVAGTRDGITSLQMDIKIDEISMEIMEEALAQALEGRNHILNEMEKVMKTARGQLSEFAPRMTTIQVKPEKVREIIGVGGKVIKGIIEATGVKINIEDDGKVQIASADGEALEKAIAMVQAICAEPEVGRKYHGKVMKITDFGAFVEVLPNTSGLLHISEIAHERIRDVRDVLSEGDMVDVIVLDVDRAGRIRLSRKALLDPKTENKSH